MTQDFVVLLGALAALFLPMGMGARWLLTNIDTKAAISAVVEQKARDALTTRFEGEINYLKERLERMEQDKHAMEKDRTLFIRRIYQLEHFIHMLPGVATPVMEGWPPQ